MGESAAATPPSEASRALDAFPDYANADTLRGRHPALGEINLNLRYAGLMEFSFGSSILDSWDDDY